jgi:hypothetical protein
MDGWVHVDIGLAPPKQWLRDLLLSHARGEDRR